VEELDGELEEWCGKRSPGEKDLKNKKWGGKGTRDCCKLLRGRGVKIRGGPRKCGGD